MALGQRRTAAFFGVLVLSALVAMHPRGIWAFGGDCGYAVGDHYAGQETALDNTYTQCGTTNEYAGWNGIDGFLVAPTTLASLGDYSIDHVAGAFSAQIDGDRFWLQPGWYTGTIGVGDPSSCIYPTCTRRSATYGWYIENKSPAGYQVEDFGTVSFGYGSTVYMIYDSISGCWQVTLAYGGTVNWSDCSQRPYTTGAMRAFSEMVSNSGAVAGLPPSYFGYSNPNTNEALRLHGGNGWVPWTSSLSSYYTDRFDEHNYHPAYTNLTLDSFWYFENYLCTTC